MRFGSASSLVLAALGAVSLSACGALYGEPAPQSSNPLEELLRQQGQQPQVPPADPAAQAAFLQQNRARPGVTVTGSGLQYTVISSGPAGGAPPEIGAEVKVNYKGTLADGTPFDASEPGEPAVFKVGDLVPGFNEALLLMKPGDKWKVVIPPQLGYGDQPRGPIPPGSVLVFELELIEVAPAAPQLG